MSARNMAKRTAAGTLALAVCLGGGALALAGAAQADANFKFDARIAGDTRYGTAIAASKAAFPDGTKTDNVVLVNGFATVDGLTASYLAGVANAPILYVSDQGADADTKAEIKRLGAKNVWLVGGTTVIPASVEAAIKGDGYTVTRINGSDRYETAKLVAEAGAKIAGKQPSKVFVASGTSFADALAVSPIAYAKGYAIALTEKDSTSDFTKKELGNIGTDNKVLVGGTAVVSDKVKADLSITNRIAGDDRAVTANLVSDWAKSTEGFSKANAALVGGTNGNGADSLVAAAPAGKSLTTLHFAGWDATSVYLKDHSAELTGKGYVFGGKAAVPGDQLDKAQAAAQTVVSNATLAVSTDAKAIQTVSTSSGDDINRGAVTYKIAVPSDAKLVNVALFDDANLVTKSGKTLFYSGTALSAGNTVIESVNGSVAAASTYAVKAAPVNGFVTVTVDATSAAKVSPVAWIDKAGGGTGALDFDTAPTATTPQAPSEAFGVGVATRWIAAEYTGGVIGSDQDVTFVNKEEGYFSTASATYKFDGNDVFYLGDATTTSTTPRSAEYFLARLTVGDKLLIQGATNTTLKTSYAPTAAQGSSFVLNNATPVTPSSVAAAQTGATTVTVTIPGVASDATLSPSFKVYGGLTAGFAAASAPLLATATTDADTSASGFQVKLTGLAASTGYSFVATRTVGGEESERSNVATATTAAFATPVSNGSSLVDVGGTNGAANNVLDSGDRLDFSYSSAVSVASTYSVVLRDNAGRERTINESNSTVALANDGKIVRVTLTGAPIVGSGVGNLNVADFQVISSSGISNSTGTWSLVGSGDTRQLAGSIPAALAGSAVTLTASSDTVAITGLTGGTTYTAKIWDTKGALVGSITDTGTNLAAGVVLGSDLAASTSYYVTYELASGNTRINSALLEPTV